ncbi:GNAT family N-acetyltransferase [Sphingomonas immobilis]|uniref:GNAT family protein n=1 Tax=Sphingomonas immobilis TaxID=3063997 RepID=A0ABT9A522_9SPHN|nr:GNAT family protein [Sphingomonas sp. CA1-15]MDO7844325.1 GNAT family protein [Sphingomonas sp. CA1-15]
MNAWTDPPVLVGEHVTLRPLVREDRDALQAASDGGAAIPFFASVWSASDPDAFLDKIFAAKEAGRMMPFAALSPGGEIVGLTRFVRMNEGNRRVEIGGTFYAPSVRRTGLNTEAKLLLLGHAFEVMDCVVVEIRTDAFNRRSQAAIERLGAKRDGLLRNHSIIPDGRVRDVVVYSIIASEWPGVKQNLRYLLATHA